MVPTVRLADLHLDEVLDKGGQGAVHSLADRPDQVFKQYFLPTADGAALSALVGFPATLSPGDRRTLLESAAWPTEIVVEGHRTAGFLMQRVPARFAGRKANGRHQLRELQYLLFPPKPLWGDIEPLDVFERLFLARRFIEVMGVLHRRSVVLGDISMRNILWAPGEPPELFILDCDSACVAGTVLPQADTPDWNDPESRTSTSDLDSDRYKIALTVGRILSCDAYVRPGTGLDLLDGLPDEVAAAVGTTFARAAGGHGTRPTVDEWARALSGRASIPLTPPAPRPPMPVLPLTDTDRRGPRGVIQLRPYQR
ncbi:hypothetical protein [Catenuloplanes japonicus]|uniref:hypothetical protein n=1 Tax=Catenuloplanes japonicus TaxID=33876 RepID=UPI0005252C37|nr:hypothetical protein [Catenuloplanes japonicus]